MTLARISTLFVFVFLLAASSPSTGARAADQIASFTAEPTVGIVGAEAQYMVQFDNKTGADLVVHQISQGSDRRGAKGFEELTSDLVPDTVVAANSKMELAVYARFNGKAGSKDNVLTIVIEYGLGGTSSENLSGKPVLSIAQPFFDFFVSDEPFEVGTGETAQFALRIENTSSNTKLTLLSLSLDSAKGYDTFASDLVEKSSVAPSSVVKIPFRANVTGTTDSENELIVRLNFTLNNDTFVLTGPAKAESRIR